LQPAHLTFFQVQLLSTADSANIIDQGKLAELAGLLMQPGFRWESAPAGNIFSRQEFDNFCYSIQQTAPEAATTRISEGTNARSYYLQALPTNALPTKALATDLKLGTDTALDGFIDEKLLGIRFHLVLEVDAVLAKGQSGDAGASPVNTYTLSKAETSGKIQLVALVVEGEKEQALELSQDPSGPQINAVQSLINQAVAGMIEVIKNKRNPS